MKFLKTLVLASAVLLLAAADSHAFDRRRIVRRTCVSPAPVQAPRYQTIPPAGVPAIPPVGFAPARYEWTPSGVVIVPAGPVASGPVTMPAVGVVTLPVRPVFHAVQQFGQCVGGLCSPR